MSAVKNRFVLVLLVLSVGVIAPPINSQSNPSNRVSEKDVLLVRRVDPIYPDDARQASVHGTVMLHIIIGIDGAVKSLKVLQGPPSLVPAAAEAVRQWRYKPYLLDGRPTEVQTTVTVNFALQAPIVETLPCSNAITPAARSSETSEKAGPQGGESFQQSKAHFAAAMTALQDAKQIESQLKSRSAVDKDQLRAKFGSACGSAVTEFQHADQLTGPNEKKNHSAILANLASTYALAGRHNDAAATFQRAIEWQPSSELYANISTELGKEGKFADASAACESAINLDPKVAGRCWLNIGIVLYNSGHFIEATGYLEKASASDPRNAMGWYLLGDSLRNASTFDKSAGSGAEPRIAEAYRRCLQLDPEGPYAERARTALKGMNVPVSVP
jgi:TonB family protein